MQSTINEILKKIEALQKDLKSEYEKVLEKYGYEIEKGKVIFLESMRARNAKFKENLFKYVFTADFKQLVSVPFIYSVFFPLVALDIFIWFYQTFAFPLYGIPKVKRSDYIVYDRQFLDYLNLIQKVNCIYCTYANGLLAYVSEIAGRTERYWCPIKAARNPRQINHAYYRDFADYGDAKGFLEVFNQNNCFEPTSEKKEPINTLVKE